MAAIPTPPPQQQPFNNPPQRQGTQPPFAVGIAAGAEDVKYQAKYKDLKRKVKEIEADNDKLHFKVLQAKRGIQRMKLERAVLYERLQQVPPSPEMQDRLPLPPVHQPIQHHPMAPVRGHQDRMPQAEYVRPHGGGTLRQEGRAGTMDSPMAPSNLHATRRGSVDGPGQLQFMQHLPPVQQQQQHQAQIHASPHHPRASNERSPSRTRAAAHLSPPIYHPPYPDVQHSPALSDRGPHTRRHDMHEGPRHPTSMPPLSPSSDARTTRSGNSGAIHNHQRIGPGTYVNREDVDRDWDRGRMRSPPAPHHSYPPDPPSHRRRDEASSYYAERRPYSRSTSVGSASGSGSVAGDGPSRRASPGPSLGAAQFYDAPPPERERAAPGAGGRSFRLRPVAQADEVDFVHEDGRGATQVMSASHSRGNGGGYAPPPDAQRPEGPRKRSRNDMDVDDDGDGAGGSGMYARQHERDRDRDAEPRGKRYHPSSDRM
ncbi:hypothetical protein DFH06DRAFT_1314681 [Mycena polygramma]|nr:hypothetical protein DFH06DRAFT_1314681 [Mycena polygramma]